MNRTGKELLSRSTLPKKQNGGVATRCLFCGLELRAHPRACPDNQAIPVGYFLRKDLHFPFQAVSLKGPLYDQAQVAWLKGLGNKVIGTFSHSLDSRLNRPVSCNHQHWNIDLAFADLSQHLNPFHPRHLDV